MDVKASRPSERDLRCACGSLMARLTRAGVELKCRRCKRVVVVPVECASNRWVEVNPPLAR
jgi:phage FluMu protein Com